MTTNLKTQSTTALLSRMRQLETLARVTRKVHEVESIEREWRAVCAELNARPTDAVLAAL